MLSWHYITAEQYSSASAESKTADKLFFISDTGELYRGTQPFNQAVEFYDHTTGEPATKAAGRVYVDSSTLEGKVWNGAAWTTVIAPISSTVSATDSAGNPVNSTAVIAYVADEIAKVTSSTDIVKSLSWDGNTATVGITMADGLTTNNLVLDTLGVDLSFEAGLLKLKDVTGNVIGTGINLDLERFVESGSYDPESGDITLIFNDNTDPVVIPVDALIDTYTAADGKGVSLTVSNNQFVAEAIVASTEGNMLQLTDSGLFVAATPTNGKADKVIAAIDGHLAGLDADGNLTDAGVAVGGATLSANDVATLATEAAVNAVRTSLINMIDGKMNKIAAGNDGKVLIASGTDAGVSAVTIGGAELVGGSGILATEGAVIDYVGKTSVAQANISTDIPGAATASDTKVASEKAVATLLEWKSTV